MTSPSSSASAALTGSSSIDQSLPLSCKIVSTETAQYTTYVLRVRQGAREWTVRHRYSDFCTLHAQLQVAALPLELPPKQMIGNKSADFVAARRAGLQRYLDQLMSHLMLSTSVYIWMFLVPNAAHELIAQSQAVSIALRNLRGWELRKVWKHAGWRFNKSFSLVQPMQVRSRCDVLSWVSEPEASSAGMQKTLAFLTSLSHPYLLAPLFTWTNTSGALIVYPYLPDGMLRDQFCKARPQDAYVKKFCNPDTVYPLSVDDIRHVGRHVLEALLFLKKLGIPYGNLHASNIGVLNSGCVLTDVESGVLMLRSYYWPLLIQCRYIQSLEQLDMYCFGHTLFELATGDALMQPSIPFNAPLPCDRRIQALLYDLLTEESMQAGLPTIEDLIAHDLFACVPVSKVGTKQLSMCASVRATLDAAAHTTLNLLRTHQAQFRESVRTIKYEKWLNSDEHRKQRQQVVRQFRLFQWSEQSSKAYSADAAVSNNNNSDENQGTAAGGTSTAASS